jgi:hypothetical protein
VYIFCGSGLASRRWRQLTSNVRQHGQAPRCASISIQMQSVAAIGSIQSVASCFLAFAKVVATQRSCPSASASPVTNSPVAKTLGAHSMGGSRLAKLEPRPWGHVCALLGISMQGCQSRSHLWPFQVCRLEWERRGRAAIESGQAQVWWQCVAGFSYSRAVQSRNAVQLNQSLKRSANGVAHWLPSAGPAAHFALAIQRATPLAYRLALR